MDSRPQDHWLKGPEGRSSLCKAKALFLKTKGERTEGGTSGRKGGDSFFKSLQKQEEYDCCLTCL